MAGVRQKHPDALVYRRGGRVKALVTVGQDGKRQIQPADLQMPDGLEPHAQRVWEETVEVARQHLYPSDSLAVERWIHYVNEWVKTTALIAEEGVVVAGRHESRLNPRVRYLKICEEQIARSETVLGLTPLARMRLGITFAMEQSALAALKGGQPVKPALMDPDAVPKRRKARA